MFDSELVPKVSINRKKRKQKKPNNVTSTKKQVFVPFTLSKKPNEIHLDVHYLKCT